MTDTLETLTADRLAVATGGIFYGEQKSPTGERWAAALDASAKSYNDHIGTSLDRNVTGVVMIPVLGVGEFVARQAGRLWDRVQGARP